MSTIPHDKEPFLDASGRISRSWRTYLASLTPTTATTQLQQQIDTLWEAINAASGQRNEATAQLNAIGSLNITGTLASGFVVLSLDGDADAPGTACYYGTNEGGVKGWFPVPVSSVNGKTGQVSLTVSALSDVDSTGLSDKKVLAWDAASNRHVYVEMGDTGAPTHNTEICVSFNGINQWGDIVSLPSSVMADTPRTFLALYAPMGDTGSRQELFCGGGTDSPQLRIGAQKNESALTYYEASTDGSVMYGGAAGADSATKGIWTAHAGKYDAGRCYVATHSVPWTDTQPDAAASTQLIPIAPFTIARRYNAGTPDRYFKGYLHSVGVFNRSLTSVEITDFFTHKDLTSIDNLVSGWRFGTPRQTTVPNLISGQADCILSGTPDYVRVRI
ncbi:MAG TPA: LamG-like jellyroll fold domain-containing protein [Xylella sp.]